MRIVGVDPGINGAIAVIDCTEDEITNVEVIDFPRGLKYIDVDETVKLYNKIKYADLFVCELVHSFPGQGVASSFSFGVNYGIALLLGSLLSSNCHYVIPMTWKKYYGIAGQDKKTLKSLSVLQANAMFPSLSNILLKSKDGRSEALLIAEYGRRYVIKEQSKQNDRRIRRTKE